MGSGDGAGDSELWEDVIYFHGSAVKLYDTRSLGDALGGFIVVLIGFVVLWCISLPLVSKTDVRSLD